MTVPGNPYRYHTHRLDLEDPSIREWAATVLLADPDQGIVLDQSAFYPGGGGQPPDHGVLLWGNVRTWIVGAQG
jgi:misacylated tRNA(Ala) deacylase